MADTIRVDIYFTTNLKLNQDAEGSLMCQKLFGNKKNDRTRVTELEGTRTLNCDTPFHTLNIYFFPYRNSLDMYHAFSVIDE